MNKSYILGQYGITYMGDKQNGQVKLICPRCAHARKKKNLKELSVNLDDLTWNCWHCGWQGGASKKNFTVNNNMKKEYKPVTTKVLTPTEKLYKYFSDMRHIPKEVVDRNKISSINTWMPDRNGGGGNVDAICFCYYEGEELVNIKYRSETKTFKQEKDAKQIVYKYNDVREQKVVIITEGEFDALSFEVAGHPNACSVPGGGLPENTKDASSKMEFLDNSIEAFDSAEHIYLAMDTDGPGLGMQRELARRLGKYRCYIVSYPEDCKDANDVLVKYGPEALSKCITDAEPYPLEGIGLTIESAPDIESLYHNGYPDAMTLDMPEVDQIAKWHNGLIIITGIPSHGKSNMVDMIASILITKYGRKFAYFSPENYPTAVHTHQMIEKITGKRLLDTGYENGTPRMTLEEAYDCLHYLNDHLYYINQHTEKTDGDYLRSQAALLVKRYGITDLVIDPWTEIEHDYGHLNETQYTQNELARWRTFERAHDICLWIVAHPTKQERVEKMGSDGKQMAYKEPGLYSISGSAMWANKADIGIVVHRDFDQNITNLIFEKFRFRWFGRPGRVVMRYNRDNGRYAPLGDYNHFLIGGQSLIDKYVYPKEEPVVEIPEQRGFQILPPEAYDELMSGDFKMPF